MQRGKGERRFRRAVGVAALGGFAFFGLANQDAPGQTTDGYLGDVTSATTADPVGAVAGDIACRPGSTPSATRCQQMATSDLLLAMNPDAVLTVGDNQYATGTLAEFQGSYGPSWGRLFDRTYPTPGNHEYGSPGAAGYYAYFGPRAGDPSKGYYSFDVGAWHLIALNSECGEVGGCGLPSMWVMGDEGFEAAFAEGLGIGTDAAVAYAWRARARAYGG